MTKCNAASITSAPRPNILLPPLVVSNGSNVEFPSGLAVVEVLPIVVSSDVDFDSGLVSLVVVEVLPLVVGFGVTGPGFRDSASCVG